MMKEWKAQARSEYEDVKSGFKSTTVDDFKRGDWFTNCVQWVLETYALRVDADYIQTRYPGAGPKNQARQAIRWASKINGLVSGVAAAAISALEVSSIGPQAAITVPAIATSVMGEVAFSARIQLRTTYDLSVIYGAPLLVNDIEDCHLLFLTAMGIKLQDLVGNVGTAIGPKVASYNVRRLLRTGLRKALQEALKKIGGSWLARKLTERALMRVLVPGISIPIAYGFSRYSTRKMLESADRVMRIRGHVVRPVARAFIRDKDLDKLDAARILIHVANAGDREAWAEEQMNALRYCQSTLALSDEQLATLEQEYDCDGLTALRDLHTRLPWSARRDFVELAQVVAALMPSDVFDDAYGVAVATLSGDTADAERTRIEEIRRDLH
jgi:hypothetical protein